MKKVGLIVVVLVFVIVCTVFFLRTNFGKDIESRVITGNNIAKFENPKNSFKRDEIPSFTISIPYKTNESVGKTQKNKWIEKNENLVVQLLRIADGSQVPSTIYKQAPGKFKITLASSGPSRFGNYKISVTAKESFSYSRDLTQDFSWGVLAVNTNKSIYLPNETARLGFGVLDERGNTLCNAKLTLQVSDPDKNIKKLTTDNSSIKRNPKCIDNYYSLEEDYKAFYKTGKSGRYYLNLTAETKNGTYTISDYFEVRDSVPFEVERTQFPSRIYPVDSYPVKLTIKADEDYKGVVYDLVPIDFQITDISGGGKVSRTKNSHISLQVLTAALKDEAKHLGEQNYKIKYSPKDIPIKVDKTPIEVEWNVDWKKGNTYVLTYNIYFPQVSPEYYLLGPFTIGSFKEVRNWQVASDATKCWDGGGGDNNWNTAANWASDTNPTSTSNATFHGASCTAGTPDKSVTVNTDPSLSGSGGGITLSSNYTGTMTQSSGITMTLTGSIGLVMAGGTFTGGNSLIESTLFNQTGGAFTSTTGTFQIDGPGFSSSNFTSSGGTFNNNSGTVEFSITSSQVNLTNSLSFYNLYLYSDCNNGGTTNLNNNVVATVSGILTLDGGGCNGSLVTGTNSRIDAKGDISVKGKGFEGDNGVIAVDNSNGATQTLTADGSDPDQLVPTLLINRTNENGSKFVISGNIEVWGDWTHTAGTVDAYTNQATVTFYGWQGPSFTITGNETFYNLGFFGGCNNGMTTTLAAGTVLTVLKDLTMVSETCGLSVDGGAGSEIDVNGNVSATETGGGTTDGTVAIKLIGPNNQTITDSSGSFPTGTFTIDKTAGTVTLGADLPLSDSAQDLTITNGVLNMGSKNLTVGDVLTVTSGQLNQTTGALSFGTMSIGSKGVWENNSTGAITVGSGGVSNSGYVHLDGGGPTCGDAIAGGAVLNNAGFVQTQNNSGGSTTSLSKAFDSNNAAGNLIVVTVDWDGSATPSVSDSRNSYTSAVGPTTGSFGKEQTFYAYNIGAGANTVTVTFSPATTSFSLLYIFEYSGIQSSSDPYDNSAAAAGSGSTMDSGSASTSNANDLIYGAGLAEATGGSAGSGFTSRNSNYGNQYEDKKVTSTGSYNATAGNDGNHYVMQMVAFKANTSVGVSAALAITSSSPGTARTWSGSGTYVLNDLNVTDQSGSLTAYNSNSDGSGWTFTSGCPAYSNRSSSKITGGAKITGGTKLKSN